MRGVRRPVAGVAVASFMTVGLVLSASGCAGRINGPAQFVAGALFPRVGQAQGGGATTTPQGPTAGAGGSRGTLDPCSEPDSRKFVRISIRNLDPLDHVHYFLAFVAFINGDAYPNGAVCPDDIDLYRSFGYEFIPEGQERPFGAFCIQGPALLYFHQAGQFRTSSGTGSQQFGSAIPPAQGTSPSFDAFFDSGGALVPVPNSILWHNPGTGEGGALKVSLSDPTPCTGGDVAFVDPECEQDAFYYVDQTDRQAGTNVLGAGSGRRVPNEIQGSGCECGGFDTLLATSISQVLAPSGATASSVQCNEFLRGGSIEYVFIRDDRNPPIPQLLWRVTDASGSVAHDFDPRANISP